MSDCQGGVGCLYDTVKGSCHATPSVCSQIECGEERDPPVPLQCYGDFTKVKPEGSCCFVCRHKDSDVGGIRISGDKCRGDDRLCDEKEGDDKEAEGKK